MRKLITSGTAPAPKPLFPPGHFYSPIAHAEALREALGEPEGAYYGGGSLWIQKIA